MKLADPKQKKLFSHNNFNYFQIIFTIFTVKWWSEQNRKENWQKEQQDEEDDKWKKTKSFSFYL